MLHLKRVLHRAPRLAAAQCASQLRVPTLGLFCEGFGCDFATPCPFAMPYGRRNAFTCTPHSPVLATLRTFFCLQDIGFSRSFNHSSSSCQVVRCWRVASRAITWLQSRCRWDESSTSMRLPPCPVPIGSADLSLPSAATKSSSGGTSWPAAGTQVGSW